MQRQDRAGRATNHVIAIRSESEPVDGAPSRVPHHDQFDAFDNAVALTTWYGAGLTVMHVIPIPTVPVAGDLGRESSRFSPCSTSRPGWQRQDQCVRQRQNTVGYRTHSGTERRG